MKGFNDAGLQNQLATEVSPHPHAQRLLRDLVAAYTQAQQSAAADGTTRPLRAYLVLETWEGSPIGDWLAAHAPAVAAERRAIPDPIYDGREDAAPAVVPLPSDWAAASAGDDTRLVLDALPHWLETTWLQSEKRVQLQPLCGIAFSEASAAGIAAHAAQLASQRSPIDGTARYFRHHDPRVMQRVWPVLSPAQQQLWLGPVVQWWAIRQAWGPWTFDDLVAIDAGTLTPPPRWFKAHCPPDSDAQQPAQMDKTQLLNEAQWAAAHTAPHGNRAWAQHAAAMTAADQQPDAVAMTECLALAASLHLRDDDLAAFIEASWTVDEDARLPPGPTPWHDEPYATALRRTLTQYVADPDAPFGPLWLQNRPI